MAALSSSPDAFSIVLLSTLGKRQSISATDMGWLPQGEMFHANSGETTSVVHTASDDEPPGTVLTQADFSGGALSLGSRDQLLIYQGAEDNPTFLCAFDWSGYDWKTTDSSVSSSYSGDSYSGLPRGLTSGVDALNTRTLGWSSSYNYNWAYIEELYRPLFFIYTVQCTQSFYYSSSIFSLLTVSDPTVTHSANIRRGRSFSGVRPPQ